MIMTAQDLMEYAESIQIKLSAEDCAEILATSHQGETPEDAVWDFLDAYEGVSRDR